MNKLIVGGRPGHPKKERRVGQLAGLPLLNKPFWNLIGFIRLDENVKETFAGQHWSSKGCTLGDPSRSCISAGGKYHKKA